MAVEIVAAVEVMAVGVVRTKFMIEMRPKKSALIITTHFVVFNFSIVPQMLNGV